MRGFANVGKAVLIQALGIQKNYKEEYVETQCFSTHCSSCQAYQLNYTFACTGCPYAKHTKKVRYVNEGNQFGYQKRLKGNALKLLLLYHFLEPDKNGILTHVSVKDAADLLHCSPKTIRNNMRILNQYGYIYVCGDPESTQHHTIMLVDYKNYSKKAHEGGRGYLVLSRETFLTLTEETNLDSLRLQLRMLIECDSTASSALGEPMAKKTYTALRRYLPRHNTRKSIQTAVEHSSIFDIVFSPEDTIFTLRSQHNAKPIKRLQMQQYQLMIETYLDELSTAVSLTDPISRITKMQSLGLDTTLTSDYNLPTFTDADIYDLSSICANYSIDLVKESIKTAFNKVLLPGQTCLSIGATVQFICQQKAKFFMAS